MNREIWQIQQNTGRKKKKAHILFMKNRDQLESGTKNELRQEKKMNEYRVVTLKANIKQFFDNNFFIFSVCNLECVRQVHFNVSQIKMPELFKVKKKLVSIWK